MLIWTAFLWGFGASCGASFGLLLFCVLFPTVEYATGRDKRRRKQEALNKESLDCLEERNDLTRATNKLLDRAARSLAVIAGAESRRCGEEDPNNDRVVFRDNILTDGDQNNEEDTPS